MARPWHVPVMAALASGLIAMGFAYWREGELRGEREAALAAAKVAETEMEAKHAAMSKELDRTKWERSWYRFFYAEYAGMERLNQYGISGPSNAIYNQAIGQFLKIEEVMRSVFCPPPGNGLLDKSYLYFGARIIALYDPNAAAVGPDLISLSYLGSREYAHDERVMDAAISFTDLASARGVIQIPKSSGILDRYLKQAGGSDGLLAQSGGYYRPLGYNAADIDADGRVDFILGRTLVLHGKIDAISRSDDGKLEMPEVPGESIFIHHAGKPHLLSLNGNTVSLSTFEGGKVIEVASTALTARLSDRLPFRLLPVPQPEGRSIFALRTDEVVELYEVEADGSLTKRSSLTGLQRGQVLTGGFGQFGFGKTQQFWVAQPEWKTPSGAMVGRIHLLSIDDLLRQAEVDVSADALFDIAGSEAFTDYDGIGTTLSLYAGDVDGDAIPDFTFSGHRHMSEAGALFVLPGSKIIRGGAIDAGSGDVIKIVGRPVSQLAPPFAHWDHSDVDEDGYSDIVVSADNDLCSGMNAGALYILSGKAVVDGWARRAGGSPRTSSGG